ncbi:T9SS type A sorting domain-containing protein [Algibacter lectus]|uniref:Secretion system C-terminal sorting domain-containing protein n=1 Tax=Algibacter lectus TaxID=221126 RepID=A0A090WAZ5_9FLAO|nr:T9SS type A sorting domain-containing protein [Algibacter lectus]GAL64707.1 hypothetical protein JCM19300_65 [Algibacter lectus]
MKLKLLLLLLVTSLGYSQNSIPTFESAAGSEFAVVSVPADQSAAGSNATWNFNVTSSNSSTSDEYSTASTDIIGFPGATAVIKVNNGAITVSKIFIEKAGNTVSFAGAESNNLILAYTNKGEIGTFPLSYPYAPSDDAIAGGFSFGENSGTFGGTMSRSVDAKGTLSVNVIGKPEQNFSGAVSRLVIIQDIALSIFPIKVADVVQTSNYYYKDNGDLVFRTSRIDISSSIIPNQSFETAEVLTTSTLGLGDQTISDADFSILPNPVKEELNINVKAEVESISIVDLSGRQVLNVKTNERKLVVDQLKSGLYIANIATDKGVFSQKFVKQ